MPRTFFSRSFGNNTSGSGSVTPGTLTIAVVDNLDGTATATYTGHVGLNHVLKWYTAKLDNAFVAGAWTQQSLALAADTNPVVDPSNVIPAGYGLYFSMVVDTSNGESSLPYFHSYHDPANSVFYRCLVAVQSTIVALSLASISSANILVRKLPYKHKDESLPCILITPLTESMNPTAGTNTRDDVGYAIQVTISQVGNQDLTSNFNRLVKWRQQIARAFRNQRLSGIAEVIMCSVEPGPVVQPLGFELQHDVTSLVVRCLSREVRGNS